MKCQILTILILAGASALSAQPPVGMVAPPRDIVTPIPPAPHIPAYRRALSATGRKLIWPVMRWPDCPPPPGDPSSLVSCYHVQPNQTAPALALNHPNVQSVYRGRKKLKPGKDYWIGHNKMRTIYAITLRDSRGGMFIVRMKP